MKKQTVKILTICSLFGGLGNLDIYAQIKDDKNDASKTILLEKNAKKTRTSIKESEEEESKNTKEDTVGLLNTLLSSFGKLSGEVEKIEENGKLSFFLDSDKSEEKSSPNQKKEIPYHTLRDEQIVITGQPYKRENPYIKEVKNIGNETHITFVHFVHFQSYLIHPTSTSYLVDLRNNEKIHPIGLTNEMPLDSVLMINNHALSMALFTLRFPRLDKKITEVIYCWKQNPDFPTPPNAYANPPIYINLDEYDLSKKKEAVLARLNYNKRYELYDRNGYRISTQQFDEVRSIELKKNTFYQAFHGGKMLLYDQKGSLIFNQSFYEVTPVYTGKRIQFEVKISSFEDPVICLNRGARM